MQTFNSVGVILNQGEISSKNSKKLVVAMIEVIDLFLLGTVFYITALGLYELFISDNIDVPEWLEIHTIDDLKGKLISVVVVVLDHTSRVPTCPHQRVPCDVDSVRVLQRRD